MAKVFQSMIWAMVLLAWSLAASGANTRYDFSLPNDDGVYLYYQITGPDEVEVEQRVQSSQNGTYMVGDIVIPSTVTYRGTTYTVTSIGYEAFYYCNRMRSITIPPTVTHIGDRAFEYTTQLYSFTWPEAVKTIPEYAFRQSGLEEIEIPGEVTSIGRGAFYKTYLQSINLPETLEYIGYEAFSGTGLQEIDIPESVTNIESYAFSGCQLKRIGLPESMTSLAANVFYKNTPLREISFPASMTRIGAGAFGDCSGLQYVTLPPSITAIDSGAFRGCNRVIAVWNYSPLVIEKGASSNGYVGYGARNVYNNCVDMGDYIFSDGVLAGLRKRPTVVRLPADYCGEPYRIGSDLFYCFSEMKALVIPDDAVTEIGARAFDSCVGLTEVHIGSGVTKIGYDAFTFAKNVTDLYCYCMEPPVCDDYAFASIDKSRCTLHIPAEAREAYARCKQWADFTLVADIENGIDGDINADGEVNSTDIALVISILLGQTDDLVAADANADGSVDVSDIAIIIGRLVGDPD